VPLLEVQDLRTVFHTSDGIVPAVDGVSFSVDRGRTLGIVGESGCGKSVTSLSVMRLIAPPGRIEGGSITFDGQDLLALPDDGMRRIRGKSIAMIFQEPMTSLNPVFTVGDQIAEAVLIHEKVDERAAKLRAIEMLERVGVPLARQRYDSYPHEMSGGMRQRVMMAMALSCDPQLLIADEPTTALDVTIQAQILELLKGFAKERHLSLMLITHDLGVIAEVADDVVVMYAGEIVESAAVVPLFDDPKHPYTQGLLASIPQLSTGKEERLNVIRGSVPNPLFYPKGCRFEPRCPYAMQFCREHHPPLSKVAGGRMVRCFHYDEVVRDLDPALLPAVREQRSARAAALREANPGARGSPAEMSAASAE
jgi:peptide/nickel transport system ATP-binding protein/oligopeptide transport system ATP-binding protein